MHASLCHVLYVVSNRVVLYRHLIPGNVLLDAPRSLLVLSGRGDQYEGPIRGIQKDGARRANGMRCASFSFGLVLLTDTGAEGALRLVSILDRARTR